MTAAKPILQAIRRPVLRRVTATPFERYERAKAAWIAEHPEAAPEAYTAAMTRLAKETGV